MISSAVQPPQTPSLTPNSLASWRHSARTGHRAQTALASSIWHSAGRVVPIGKNSSGSSSRQADRERQSALPRVDRWDVADVRMVDRLVIEITPSGASWERGWCGREPDRGTRPVSGEVSA